MFMQNVRKSMKFFFWFLAVVFILFIFFDFGTTLTQRGIAEKGYVAKVWGKYITINEYNQVYQNTISNIRRQNLGPYEQRKISDEILNNIIINKVIGGFANERNLKIDEKTAEKLVLLIPPGNIINDSSFYENGVFNQEKYAKIIQDPRFEPFFLSYKNYFMNEMPIRFMNTELLDYVRVTNSEVVQKILEDELKVKVEYLYLRPDFSSDITITDEEGKDYFKENYYLFKDIKAIISYTFFPINIYEEDRKNTFEISENIISQFNAGIPFDSLMHIYSDSIYDYEIKGLKEFNDEERTYIKNMKLNEVKTVKKENGIYIYHLAEINDGKYGIKRIFLKYKPSFENATIIREKIEDFLKSYKEDSIAAMKEYNVKFNKFYYRRYGDNPIKIEYTFLLNTLKEGEFFTQLEEDGYYLIRIDRKFINNLKYEDVKDLVIEDVKKKKILQENLKKAMEIRSKIKERLVDFKDVAEYGVTDYISMNTEYGPFIKKGILHGVVFSLMKGVISSPIVGENGIFIVRVLDRKEPDIELIKSKFQDYSSMYYDLKRKMVIDEWYRNIMENAKIQDYRNIFNF